MKGKKNSSVKNRGGKMLELDPTRLFSQDVGVDKKGIVMTVKGRDGQVDGYDEEGNRWENV